MSILDKLSQAGVTTLVAMLIVFAVLVVLMFVIKLQTKVLGGDKDEAKKVDENKIKRVEKVENTNLVEQISPQDDLQLVAAIMAALSVYTGKNASELKVKSINRINSSNWINSAIESNR